MPKKFSLLARSALLVCFLTFSFAVFAQRTVTGRVTTKANQPIQGATVQVKGSTTVTITGTDGQYSIKVPNNKSSLVFSVIGYEVIEVPVGAKNDVSTSLAEATSQLSEVLVTGYSAQRKKDITGAVSVVKVSDLVSVPSGSAEQQLQGRASGVTVTSSGQPGDGASVRIRGFGSITAGNSPLYIVDGVPLTNLGDLNSNDIETIQVLKDAAAASQYGSRAGNGVLVITTKRGKSGQVRVTYDAYYGMQTRGKGFDLLDPQGNADLTWLAYRNSGQLTGANPSHPQYGNGTTPVLPDYILAGSQSGVKAGNPAADPSKYFLNLADPNSSYLIVPANKVGTNWYNEVFSSQPLMNHNIGLSGGSDRSKFYLGVNYFDQKGTVMTTFYKRYSIRANSEFNIKDKIRIGENVQLSYSNNIKIGNQSEGNEISLAYRIQPIVPVYDIAGNFGGQKGAGLGNALNPVAYRVRAKDNRNNDYKIIGNVYAEVDFLRHFTARTSIGGEQYMNTYWWYGFKTYENSENNSTNEYNEGSSQARSWTWTNQISYKNTFADKHTVSALAGVEAIDSWGRYMHAKRLGYFVDDPNFRSLNTGSGVQTNDGGPYARRKLFSVFAKATYAYNDKYLIDATVRRDGSSVFGAANRYGIFPAASVGWRISSEDFMKDMTWITDLKLRASWGQMGNQNINPDNAFSTFGGGLGSSYYDLGGSSSSVLQGFQQQRIGNPNGKWETNITTNFGFDGTFMKGRLEVILDLYSKKTKDLLFVPPLISTTQGTANAPAVNIASMENKGVDLGLTYRGTMNNGLQYNLTGTFTTYTNKITALAEGVDYFDDGGYRQGNFARNSIGHPVSSFYGYKVIGFFSDAADVSKSPAQQDAAPGRFKYADLNGDNKITDADRGFIGNPNPKFTYGLNVNLTYKGFDLGAFFYGVAGKDVVNYTSWWTDYFSSFQGAKSKASLNDAWTTTKQNARLPIVENSSNFSNQAVFNSSLIENGSYLRLKTLILGYTFSKKSLGRSGIDKLRVYVQAGNLFTVTKYRGLDPEFAGNDTAFGIDYGNYPNQKQFLFGVNVGF
jgi:TonB-linked SusC/RagA family outer membrane protein